MNANKMLVMFNMTGWLLLSAFIKTNYLNILGRWTAYLRGGHRAGENIATQYCNYIEFHTISSVPRCEE